MKSMKPQEPLIRVVDDEEEVRDSLKFMLECEGWLVSAYASGFDLLKDFDRSRPGCILLDVRMPDLSGPELQEKLNLMGNPVLLRTARHRSRHGQAPRRCRGPDGTEPEEHPGPSRRSRGGHRKRGQNHRVHYQHGGFPVGQRGILQSIRRESSRPFLCGGQGIAPRRAG